MILGLINKSFAKGRIIIKRSLPDTGSLSINGVIIAPRGTSHLARVLVKAKFLYSIQDSQFSSVLATTYKYGPRILWLSTKEKCT